ncbi:MAG: endo alpha-1,4 polygalactosaminidase [Spirochaetes bacterium]|nr:endo alpha-1,4 polygalactosaminidase [Spirochaetota bacterium]
MNYREEMRRFVELISARAKKTNPAFAVVPQNALDLITYNSSADGELARTYLSSIDAVGCEELFYGHLKDGVRTSRNTTDYFLQYLNILKENGKAVLVIDYVTDRKQADESFSLNQKYGFVSFQGERLLKKIPEWIYNKNSSEVTDILKAKNFLYLLNPSLFKSPGLYIKSLGATEHDLLVIDAFFWGRMLTNKQVALLQKKPSGAKRPVIAYLSIGEAEDYRYYWNAEWKRSRPLFLERENPNWKGNYKVKYWMDEWKEIICGRQDGTGFEKSYLKKIIDAGFDGVYLDVVDAAHYFEKK